MTTLSGTEEPVTYNMSRAGMLAGEKAEIDARRDQAIASLSERFGLGAPNTRDLAFPRGIEGQLYTIGIVNTLAFAMEAIVALTAEVDDLKK